MLLFLNMQFNQEKIMDQDLQIHYLVFMMNHLQKEKREDGAVIVLISNMELLKKHMK